MEVKRDKGSIKVTIENAIYGHIESNLNIAITRLKKDPSKKCSVNIRAETVLPGFTILLPADKRIKMPIW